MPLDYPLELGRFNRVEGVYVAFVADHKVKVWFYVGMGRGGGRGDTEDMQGPRWDL